MLRETVQGVLLHSEMAKEYVKVCLKFGRDRTVLMAHHNAKKPYGTLTLVSHYSTTNLRSTQEKPLKERLRWCGGLAMMGFSDTISIS